MTFARPIGHDPDTLPDDRTLQAWARRASDAAGDDLDEAGDDLEDDEDEESIDDEDTEDDDSSTAALGPGEAVGPASRLSDTTATASVVTSVVLPKSMVGATVGLVAFTIALTVFAGPLIGYASETAEELITRTPYIDAVLGGE